MRSDLLNLYEVFGTDPDTFDLIISLLSDDRKDAFFACYGHDFEHAYVNKNLSKAKKRKLVKAMKDIERLLGCMNKSNSDVEKTLVK